MSKNTVGISVGGGESDEDETHSVPLGGAQSVQISANQFGDDDDEPKTKDMGLDYDPPTRDSNYEMSEETLKLLEKELGMSNQLKTQGQQVSNKDEEKKSTDEKESRADKKKHLKKRLFKKEVDSKTKEERLEEWKQGGNKAEPGFEIVKVKHNEDFVTYYKGLKIVRDEEWDKFYEQLKEPLDICFRINCVDKNFDKTQKEIESLIEDMKQNEETKDKYPKLLEWYPSKLAYTFHELSRMQMRSNPLLKKFHQFLIQETENGRIFRQEAVSMIPVTLLNIEPHHRVIDMCAAPGSKTIQILEYLHQNGTQFPSGFVIANDTDSKRAYMLTHQARRLNSPVLLITNNDARLYPNLKIDKDNNNMKFDRILCDVPCSGDGTLRKNYTLWKNFNCHLGHAMHPLQLDILERAFQMLQKGGRLVYSTCSFNPIENEAVVAAALSRHIKQIELVDVSKEISPHLKYRPGMVNWKVYHKGKGKREGPVWYEKYEAVPNWKRKVIRETMFTDPYTMFNNEIDRPDDLKHDPLNLRRCLRILPHDQNQGGFFVAVFTKILDEHEGFVHDDMYQMNAWDDDKVRQKPILQDLKEFATEYEQNLKEYEDKNNIPKDQSSQNEILKMVEQAEEEQKQKYKEAGIKMGNLTSQSEKKEELFPFAKLIDTKFEQWMSIQEFYGINSDFASENLFYQKNTNNFLVFIGEGITEMMKYKRKYKMHIVNIGVKMFSKNREDKSKARYRVLQEGLEILLPFMNDQRKIYVTKELFLHLLEVSNMTFEQIKTKFNTAAFEGREHGSAVMIYGELYATIWVGINNVNLMINKEEIKSFKFLIK